MRRIACWQIAVFLGQPVRAVCTCGLLHQLGFGLATGISCSQIGLSVVGATETEVWGFQCEGVGVGEVDDASSPLHAPWNPVEDCEGPPFVSVSSSACHGCEGAHPRVLGCPKGLEVGWCARVAATSSEGLSGLQSSIGRLCGEWPTSAHPHSCRHIQDIEGVLCGVALGLWGGPAGHKYLLVPDDLPVLRSTFCDKACGAMH